MSIKSSKYMKSISFGLSLLVIFVFYILLAFGVSLAEKHILNPIIALNIPNIVLGVFGLVLMLRVNRK